MENKTDLFIAGLCDLDKEISSALSVNGSGSIESVSNSFECILGLLDTLNRVDISKGLTALFEVYARCSVEERESLKPLLEVISTIIRYDHYTEKAQEFCERVIAMINNYEMGLGDNFK